MTKLHAMRLFPFFFRPVSRILSLINRFIPKDKRLILIYSNQGFRDNLSAIHEYLASSNRFEQYRIVVCTNDYREHDISDSLTTFKPALSALWMFFRSKFVFYSFGKLPITPSPDQIVIYMSHGMPFKALSDKWFGLTFFSHVLATSGYFSDYMSKTFNCKEVYIGGQPRNDKFFDDSLNHFPGYRKIIVWMPTMRRSSKWGHDDAPSSTDLPILDERSLLEVNDLLVRNDSLLIVKFHPLQDISTHRGDLSNIKFYTQSRIDNEKIDVYSLLSISSALITDYSSVLFDYLLLNRPIGFTIDDARQYVETRGLAFPELFEHLPGSRISTHTQLFDFISDILLGKDTYSLERSKMNDLCNLYQDGGYSERLIEFLGIGETP